MILAAVAVIGLPVVMATREAAPPRPEMAQRATAADTGTLHELLDGIRGANAVQCELLMQAFVGWTSEVPDREGPAWLVSRRMWMRVTTPRDIAYLTGELRGADPCVARVAVRILGRSPTPEARSALMAALTDANPGVRRLAAVGIGFRSDSTAGRQLVRLLADGDARVRAAAAWALGEVYD